MIYDEFSLKRFTQEVQEDTATLINNLAGDDDWDDDILLYPEIDSQTQALIIREIEDIRTIAYI